MAATPQDDSEASYAPKIAASDAELDWRLPATELLRRIRAYNPVPGSWFRGESLQPALHADRVKVWQASADDSVNAAPGTLLQCDRDAVVIACGGGGAQAS